jgi:RND superfamily putative drug exporter
VNALFDLLARIAVRARWWCIAGWAVLLVLAALGASGASGALDVGGYSLTGTQADTAARILERNLQISPIKSALLVYHSDTLVVSDARFAAAEHASLARLAHDPHVSTVESFYSTGIPDMVNRDNHTTYSWLTLRGSEKSLEEAVPHLRDLARSDRLQVFLVGQVAADYDVEQASAADLTRVERFTFPVVLLLLVLVFGSLVATALPLLLGATCVLTSLAVLHVLAQLTDVSIFALNAASMIGLALAVDFSLIVVSRFREEMTRRPVAEAITVTLHTAGRSITISGIILMLTMTVLSLYPVMIIRSIALAIAITAATALLSGLLLLPALLALIGTRINDLNVGTYVPVLRRPRANGWERWALTVMRRPWGSIAIALGILLLLALPARDLHRIGVTTKVLPPSSNTREAVSLVQQQFGAGDAAPMYVVVHTAQQGGIWTPSVLEGILQLTQRLQADPRVRHVQSLATMIPNPTPAWIASLSLRLITNNPDRHRIAQRLVNLTGDNTSTVVVVYPRRDEVDPQTVGLLLDLRRRAISWAPGLAGAAVYVGGSAGTNYDFDHVVYSQFPLLLTLSLVVNFVLLMVFFHSLLLPIKAILLNLASLVASYGVVVLVFQQGYGAALLGFQSLGAVLSYTPVLLFSILFALSTDYEVFLLTRVREYARAGHTNEESVALGLEHTAGLITAAALIMIAVFGSFALTQVMVIKELGFGLAVAVFLDATLVRCVLVPATMTLLGRRNWWMPGPLDRLVPEIEDGTSDLYVPGSAVRPGGASAR